MNNPRDTAVTREVAYRSAKALFIRQGFIHGLNFVGGILLSRYLAPSDFGFFAVLNWGVFFIQTMCDIGLSYKIIQNPEAPSKSDLRSCFTFQVIMAGLLVCLCFLGIYCYQSFASAQSADIQFLKIGLLIPLFFPLQSIGLAILERNLEFKKIATIEITQGLIYQSVTCAVAIIYQSPICFVLGFLSRSMAGALLIQLSSRSFFGFSLNFDFVKSNAGRGVFFQGSTFLNTIRDGFVPFVGGYLVGRGGVGLMVWAGMVSIYPIILLNIFNRFYMPLFSRLQKDILKIQNTFGEIITWTNRAIAPLIMLIILFSDQIIFYVFDEKWMPASVLLIAMSFANIVVPTSMPAYSLMNAMGFSTTTFKLTLIWTVSLWLIGASCLYFFGVNGYGAALILVNSMSYLLFIKLKKIINIPLLKFAGPPWILCGLIAGAVRLALWAFPETNIWEWGFWLSLYLALIIIFYAVFYGREIKNLLKNLYSS